MLYCPLNDDRTNKIIHKNIYKEYRDRIMEIYESSLPNATKIGYI